MTMGFIRVSVWIALFALAIGSLLYYISPDRLPQHFGGHVEPGFEDVERVFRRNFDKGYDPDGAAFAVCHKGKLVVDLWGGYADRMALRKWKEDTITPAFSSTKGIAAICVALLVDRGLIDYNDLVIKYWPEFGKHGKDNITVKMAVSHQAGLVALDTPLTLDIIRDWRRMSEIFEDQKPDYPPGTEMLYHGYTMGWLCDQLIRRADPKRRGLSQFFREEIAVPHGIDFYIGLPRDQFHRAARVRKSSVLWELLIHSTNWESLKMMYQFAKCPRNPLVDRGLSNPDWLQMNTSYLRINDPDILELEVPAVNGIGTARALAKFYCLLDDVDRKPLLDKSLVEKFLLPYPTDPWLSFTWGLVHTLNPDGKVQIGHPGFGSQYAKFDPHQNVAFGYLRNSVGIGGYLDLEKATYESIKKLKSMQSDST